jgi:hypothetical protein
MLPHRSAEVNSYTHDGMLEKESLTSQFVFVSCWNHKLFPPAFMQSEMSPDCGMAHLGDLIKFKVHSFLENRKFSDRFSTPKRRKIGGASPLRLQVPMSIDFSNPERSQEMKCH